jgi:hypothetical protein
MAEVVFMSIADFNRFRHDRKYRKRPPNCLKNSEHLDRKPFYIKTKFTFFAKKP